MDEDKRPDSHNTGSIKGANVNTGSQIFERDAHFTYIQTIEPLLGRIFISAAPRHGRSFATWFLEELAKAHYAVSSNDDTEEWRSAISRAETLIVLLTSDSAREDSPVTEQLRYARGLRKRIIVMRCQSGFTPVDLLSDTYLDAQRDKEAALSALLDKLAGKPRRSQHWITPGEMAWQRPEIFIGRQELLTQFDHVLHYLPRDGRSMHVIYGPGRSGKTTLLHRVRDMAVQNYGALTLYADLDPVTMADENRLPADEVISLFWVQLLQSSPDAQSRLAELQTFTDAVVWLRRIIEEVSKQRPLVILLDNLHADPSGLIVNFLDKLRGSALIIATSLQDAFTPGPSFSRTVHPHTLGLLQPREIGLMFDTVDIETGREIQHLTDGVPEVTVDMLRYWIEAGHLVWQNDRLTRLTDLTLPDLWTERLEARLETALEELPLPEDMELEDLLDWITCAAVQGVTFSEKAIFKALEDEFPPEHSATLVAFLASAKHPIIQPTACNLPFEDRCWQFSPAGLRELILRDANPDDVARYGEAVLSALEHAAHPDPWPLRHQLHRLAKETLDYLLLSLQEKGMEDEEIDSILRSSYPFGIWQKYGGGINRETQIFGLKIQLSLAQTPQERWPLLKRLAQAMQGYEANHKTAILCQQARAAARRAKAEGHELAYLFYLQSTVSRDIHGKALRLLKAGWCSLPAPIRQQDILSSFLIIRDNPQHPKYNSLNRVLSREVMDTIAALLIGTGQFYNDVGENQKALTHLEQALLLFRAVGDRSGAASTLNSIGLAWSDLGEKHKALTYYEQALPLHRAVGDRSGAASTLNNIGSAWSDLGEKHKALMYYEQALLLHLAVGDRNGEASTLNNIGLTWSALGENEKTLRYYEQALPLHRALGDRGGEATTLTNIGLAWSALGENEKALTYYEQALPLLRAVGDRGGEASTLNNIGSVWSALGEKEKALTYHEQALPLHRAVGNRGGEAATLTNTGRVWSDLGEKQKALTFYEQALPLFHAIGDRGGEAGTLNNIGSVWLDLGEKQKAIEYLEQAIAVTFPQDPNLAIFHRKLEKIKNSIDG